MRRLPHTDDLSDLAAAIEQLAPGSGASLTRDDGVVTLTYAHPPDVEPTDQAISDALAQAPARQAAQAARRLSQRARVKGRIEAVKGTKYADLDAPKIKALVGALLHQLGALDDDDTIRVPDWL